jgi:hypothetical protein
MLKGGMFKENGLNFEMDEDINFGLIDEFFIGDDFVMPPKIRI